MPLTVALAVLLLLLSPTMPSQGQDRLAALAANGQIQENAPVKATSEMVIRAPIAKVWQILTAIDEWPKWQSTVSAAHLSGRLEPGTTFTWTNGGAEIKSRLALVQRPETIGWTGTAYKAHAIHIWSLRTLPDGNTLVRSTESMDGLLLTLFYSSKDLEKSHQIWLQALKHKAEE